MSCAAASEEEEQSHSIHSDEDGDDDGVEVPASESSLLWDEDADAAAKELHRHVLPEKANTHASFHNYPSLLKR